MRLQKPQGIKHHEEELREVNMERWKRTWGQTCLQAQLNGPSAEGRCTASSASWGPTAQPQWLHPHPIAPGLPGLQTALYSCLVPCIGTATYLFYFQCFECFCTELFACYWNLKFIINKDTWSNIFTPIPWLWIYSPSAPESWHSIYYVL